MERKRQIPRTIRPYLTTSEVTEIAGVTPRVLRNYVDKGIATPLGATVDEYYDRWSFGQTVDLQLIQSMRPASAPLSDIMDVVMDGEDALLDAAYLWTAEGIRHHRRMLKATVHRKRQAQRFKSVGIRNAYYLRYLPQRWMALIPATTGEPSLVDTDLYTQRFIDLKRIIEIVGWSPSFSAGTLISMSPTFDNATDYVFFELSSPPMPHITGSMIVDGGCYRAIDDTSCPQCANIDCQECSRFGRLPTDEERSLWKRVEVTGRLLDRTAMADTTTPYVTGMWADCFPGANDSSATCGHKGLGEHKGFQGHKGSLGHNGPWHAGPTVRPRLMPHETRLPLGVTACVLPAGIYLCSQNNYEERESALQRMLGVLSVMSERRMTDQDEVRMAKAAEEAEEGWGEEHDQQPGPFVEPFAAPRDRGDPAMFGFVQDAARHDLSKLILPSDMGLAPENGRVIVHADVPIHANTANTRQELQILVDVQNVAPLRADEG